MLVDHLLKLKKEFKKLKKTRDTKYIYKSELDKVCFDHDMVYGDFKDLARKAAFDKVLRDKAFNIAPNLKHDGYLIGLASIVYSFFNKESKGCGGNNKIKQNELLAEEFDKPIMKKFLKRRVYSSFKDNVWGSDSADMN